jgi:hypothetical protein
LTGDAVRIASIQPPVSQQLVAGQSTSVTATVQYSLESQQELSLYVLLAPFPAASSCGDTTGWIAGQPTPIQRGQGEVTVTVPVTVPSSSGRLAVDVIYYDFSTFTIVKDFSGFEAYCYPYGP